MHQRNYIQIAAIIDSARSQHGELPVLDDVTRELVAYFKRDNPRFDRMRFLEACGMDHLKGVK